MNKEKDCPKFEFCNASLCPMDNSSLSDGIWYPDEEICPLNIFCTTLWIRNQKKIAKKCRVVDSYFTCRILQHNFVIGQGVSGLDPYRDISTVESDESKWLKNHPQKREMSDSEKEVLRNRMLEINHRLTPTKKHASIG